MFSKNYIYIYYMFLVLYHKKNIFSKILFKNINLVGLEKFSGYFLFSKVFWIFSTNLYIKYLKTTLRYYIQIFTYIIKNDWLKLQFYSIIPKVGNYNTVDLIFNRAYISSTKTEKHILLVLDLLDFYVFYTKKFSLCRHTYKKYNTLSVFFTQKYFLRKNEMNLTELYIYIFIQKFMLNDVKCVSNIFTPFYDKIFIMKSSINMNRFFLETIKSQNRLDNLNSNYDIQLFSYYINQYNFKTQQLLGVSLRSFFFFEIFLKKFFEVKYQQKIYLTFVKSNVNYLLNNVYYLSLIKRLKKLQIFSKQSNLVKEIVEILTLVFYTHDIILLKNWLINVSEKLHFKSHKKLFYILKVIIIKYFNLYFKYFGCLGFCLKINGKIGLGGSSKTKSFWIKVGKFSLSKKSLKIAYTSGCIRTYSGILGMELILSYI